MPDLLTVCPSSPRGRFVIGWQIKNYGETKLGFPGVREELEKFDLLVRCGSFCEGVLVFLLNGDGTEDVERCRGTLISGEHLPQVLAGLHPIFTRIQQQIQLIILSMEEMEYFIGSIQLLKELRNLSS